jgi:hypothetical protein
MPGSLTCLRSLRVRSFHAPCKFEMHYLFSLLFAFLATDCSPDTDMVGFLLQK